MTPSRHLNPTPVIVILVVASLSGCLATSEIRPAELFRLDGYVATEAPRPERELETLDGGKVALRSGSVLSLDVPDGRVGGRFASITVHDGSFVGKTLDGRTVEVPIGEVRAVDITQHNVAGTIAWIAGGFLVAGAAAYVWTHRGGTVATPVRAGP
ncbi:MAG TPA: hypothetical protein VGK52_07505 [Polyangia bacterium]